MGDNRQTYKLSDIAKLRNGAAIKQEYFTDAESGVNLIKVSNFTTNSIDMSGVTKVDIEHAKKWITHRIKANDILIATVGSWPPNWSSVVGKVVRAPSETHGAIQNQNTCCIIPSEQVDQDYLYYLLKTQCFLEWIVNSAQGSANQARVPVKNIGDFSIELPSIDYQAKISKILNAMDVKIDLNRQINQTLEQMAQTLFKSWFVDFDPVVDNALDAGFFEQDLAFSDELLRRVEVRKAVRESDNFKPLSEDIRRLFPDAFEECAEPALGLGGWVPKRWVYKAAENIANVSIGKTPPRKESEWFSEQKESNITWVSIRDMGEFGTYTGSSREYLTANAVKKFNIKLVPKGSILLSFKLTLGRVAIASEELTTNEAIAHFVEPKHDISASYLYCYLTSFDFNSLGSTSSIATAVNSKIIKNMPILVPTKSILNCFKTKVEPLFRKMKLIDDEIVTLTKLRDTLLPKLISGELSLSDIKIDIPEETLI
ncbi:restriction endonuclease subunit S [Proteus mirabilis]|uniref:restriction endonuclease subunit S n=1 Tax=Proteus mirabilis TaxID=584 RepID=UPI00234AC533|nr:restriction endonuclease subunit S [Proteus mirabilis]MDC5895518.1 restriction endonuclease subunit S [Proteus mirabilis]MDC5916653.1 restriction endonuclease subunit S [Proteus mirabilis]MDC5927169.1 restriction endonuclease subunit S [Proteus mirabilis]MDC6012161.1 restriction endonuclease subunit S [Proteus mirabilis]MDC6022731.1 restriction endonuclease subunit S [Proteus mirabilis]